MFENKVKFQSINPHPIFHVSKLEHKTSPAPFEVVHTEIERDLTQPTITYGKIIFCNLNIPLPSGIYTILYITTLILHSHLFTFTFSIPITPSDTENYLPSDDPNITNLTVSRYDCAHVLIERVDRTIWNHNTMPLPATLDPLECKNVIGHLKGTNNNLLNNLHYNKLSHFWKSITFKNV